jgi:hypothetical protein
MDSYFLRKDVTFLPLNVGGAPGAPGGGSGCTTRTIWEGDTGGVIIGSEGVLGVAVPLLEMLADMYC